MIGLISNGYNSASMNHVWILQTSKGRETLKVYKSWFLIATWQTVVHGVIIRLSCVWDDFPMMKFIQSFYLANFIYARI